MHAVKFLCDKHIIRNLSSIQEGFSHVCKLTGLMGRWQQVGTEPTVICDTGHNVGGWRYISQQLKFQSYNKLHIVFGMVDDKDIDGVMNLLPQNAHYYFTRAQSKRAIPEETVQKKAFEHKLYGECYDNVPKAYESAYKQASPNDLIFIGGSSYIVSDLLLYLHQQHVI